MASSWIPSLRGLPRTFWLLWVGALINRLGGFVATFLALYLTGDRGFSLAATGLIVTLYGVGSFVSGPVGGLLADRWGRRPSLILSLLLGPAALILLSFARAPTHIALAALLYGFCADLFRPANHAMVADVVPPMDRARAFGIMYWAINLGFSLAAIVGGIIAGAGPHGYRLLFALDAGTTLLFAALVVWAIPESHPSPDAAKERLTLGQLWVPFRDRSFAAFLGLAFLSALIFQQFFVALPLDMRAHGVGPAVYGPLMAVNGLLIVLLQPLALPHFGRARRSQLLALACVLIGAGFGVNAVARAIPLYAAGIVLWTLGEIVQAPLNFAVVADLAPVDQRGQYQGLFQMSWGASLILAPLVGSFVLQQFGGPVLWTGCLVLGLLLGLGHLSLAPARGRRLAQLAGSRLATLD